MQWLAGYLPSIIEEADGIMADVLAGLAFLTSQPELMKALQHNVRCIYKAIARQKGREGELKVQLMWPSITQELGYPTA